MRKVIAGETNEIKLYNEIDKRKKRIIDDTDFIEEANIRMKQLKNANKDQISMLKRW